MYVVYLAGNSLSNRDWIEKVKDEFDSFSAGEILYYDHWTNGKDFVDIEAESKKLIEVVKGQKEYFIFAKSVGSILALKTIYEGTIHPKKIILCGHPYLLAKQMELPIDDYLKSLAIPVIFVQNEFDPLYAYSQLEMTLKACSPLDYRLVKIPNNDTHGYGDLDKLAELTKEFFV